MDPRVRARRIAVRRAKGRKRLIWVAIAAAILRRARRRRRRAGLVAVRRANGRRAGGGVHRSASSCRRSSTNCRATRSCWSTPVQIERAAREHRVGRVGACVDPVPAPRVHRHPRTQADRHVRRAPTASSGSSIATAGCSTSSTVCPIDYMLVTGANPDVERGQFAGRPFASAAQLAIALPTEIRALTRVDRRRCHRRRSRRCSCGDDLEVQLGPATDLSTKAGAPAFRGAEADSTASADSMCRPRRSAPNGVLNDPRCPPLLASDVRDLPKQALTCLNPFANQHYGGFPDGRRTSELSRGHQGDRRRRRWRQCRQPDDRRRASRASSSSPSTPTRRRC